MVKVFETKQYFWHVRRFLQKFIFLFIFSFFILITWFFEGSWYFTILLLSIGIIISFVQFRNAYQTDFNCLVFDDDNKKLTVISYKYGFNKLETSIPYTQLWYIKGNVKNYFSKIPNMLNIQMRNNYTSEPDIDFEYGHGLETTFTDEQYIAILEELSEKGHNYLEYNFPKAP